MAIEIVDLPIKNGWILHSYVKLPGWYQELLSNEKFMVSFVSKINMVILKHT